MCSRRGKRTLRERQWILQALCVVGVCAGSGIRIWGTVLCLIGLRILNNYLRGCSTLVPVHIVLKSLNKSAFVYNSGRIRFRHNTVLIDYGLAKQNNLSLTLGCRGWQDSTCEILTSVKAHMSHARMYR
jgi:hypothetical protein